MILNIAHRGGMGLEPENTLRAFSRAYSSGADGIEFDVQRTADGRLVVFHDKDLERITGFKANLKDTTFSELQKLDAGKGEKVPLLEETLYLAYGFKLVLIIELKNPEFYPGIEKQLLDLISGIYHPGLVRIASFNMECLERLRILNPTIHLVRNFRFNMPSNNEHYDTASIDARNLKYFPWRLRGYRMHCRDIFVWVVNRKHDMRYFIKAGVNAIITDYPDRLNELIDKK